MDWKGISTRFDKSSTNEIYEIKITGMVAKLNPDLGTSDNFTLQIVPPQGAVVHIERRTPVLLDDYNDLG